MWARARVGRARVGMEFKLNLDAHDGQMPMQTGADLDINRRATMAARGGMARVAAATRGAQKFWRDQNIMERAREAGRNNWQGVVKFYDRWDSWLKTVDTNFPLLISNVLYIGVSLTALILAMLVANEHVGDLRRNELSEHQQADGSLKQYAPCGMPTPDSMYLLQAIGTLPAAGWDEEIDQASGIKCRHRQRLGAESRQEGTHVCDEARSRHDPHDPCVEWVLKNDSRTTVNRIIDRLDVRADRSMQ